MEEQSLPEGHPFYEQQKQGVTGSIDHLTKKRKDELLSLIVIIEKNIRPHHKGIDDLLEKHAHYTLPRLAELFTGYAEQHIFTGGAHFIKSLYKKDS